MKSAGLPKLQKAVKSLIVQFLKVPPPECERTQILAPKLTNDYDR